MRAATVRPLEAQYVESRASMRSMLTVCAAVTLLFVGLTLATRLIGARTYHQPALLAGLDACESPCWHGIVLGQTNIADANAILNAQGFSGTGSQGPVIFYRAGTRDCWAMVTYIEYAVTNLRFSGCEPMTIGDMALTLGPPGGVIATGGAGDWLRWGSNQFDAGVNGWISPRALVSSIGLNAPSGDSSQGTPWHGFVPFWRYCRLETVPYYCAGAIKPSP